MLLLWNIDIVATLLETDTHTSKLSRYYAQIIERYILDCQFRTGHCRHTDETTDFNHIGQHRMCSAAQLLDTLYGEQVGGYARNLGTHTVQHSAKLLYVWLARGI